MGSVQEPGLMGERLRGQTAWISGAASGIGAATARLFTDQGAKVAAVDINAPRGLKPRDGEPDHLGMLTSLQPTSRLKNRYTTR